MGYEGRFVCGDPGGVRTRDLSLRRRTLSSTELRGQMVYKRVHKRSRTCTKHVHGTAHISMVISVPCAADDMAQLRVNFLLIISYENECTNVTLKGTNSCCKHLPAHMHAWGTPATGAFVVGEACWWRVYVCLTHIMLFSYKLYQLFARAL